MGLFGRKLSFDVKSCFKCFWEISDFERIWLSCFEMKNHVYKYSLNGLSARDTLAKTELKTDRKSKFYVWKRENEILEKSVSQSGTIVRPCAAVACVFMWLGSTIVRPVGTAVPTPLCTAIFHFLTVF